MSLQQILMAILTLLIVAGILYFFLRKMEAFESRPTVTYYYLPSCGWCQKFTPTWEEFEVAVKAQGIQVSTRKVNGNEATEEVDKFGIQGFPHVQMVQGDKVAVFEGERTVSSLIDFAKKTL